MEAAKSNHMASGHSLSFKPARSLVCPVVEDLAGEENLSRASCYSLHSLFLCLRSRRELSGLFWCL
jgi:hypothetical protein